MENYNHKRPVEAFVEQIQILRDRGHRPIAVSQMICEDVFVFETEDEAKRAAEELEFNPDKSKNELQAWWYGRESFLKAVEEYENNLPGVKVLVHWL